MSEYGSKKIPFLFIIDFEMNNPLIFRLDEIDSSKILFQINDIKNYNNDFATTEKLSFNKIPLPFDEYHRAFEKVMIHIKEGNTYLCNLTFPTRIEMNYALHDVFYASRAKYKLYYDDLFTVFSPECFVKINNGKIFSFPMKGTIDASIPDAEQIILADKKELAEHTTIVDLIRNDLSIVSKNVIVENFRYVEKIMTNQKDLLQISSKICGTLPENYPSQIGNIIFNLLPAGSISGAPKKKTVEIIKEAENYNRGYYTGVFGFFDGTSLDSAVMIRFIEKIDGEYYFKSGGGITYMSDPKSEYQELIDKVYVLII
ncbi:MAG: aminodeoxychorismate synthase component I [Melioribacteraceae bacterium]|nr:aminodeoxychorismate synthase component I [Melioribacteraceae bacterium]